MQPTLSALLPVRNAQATLEAHAHRLLDVLPELTHRFQLVIADDCSTDATPEIAQDLASCYPQICLVHHARPMGRAAALRSGLAQCSAGVVYFEDPRCTLAIDEAPKLWRAVDIHEAVIGRAVQPSGFSWGRLHGVPRGSGNYQFVHRSLLDQLQMSLADDVPLRDVMMDLDLRWLEVDVRDRDQPSASKGLLSKDRHRGESSWADPAETDASRPRTPNYLKRLRDFAFGE